MTYITFEAKVEALGRGGDSTSFLDTRSKAGPAAGVLAAPVDVPPWEADEGLEPEPPEPAPRSMDCVRNGVMPGWQITVTCWPLPCDCYLLRFPPGSSVPPHLDAVPAGRHYRLNIVLRAAQRGGAFVCARPIHAGRRVKLFRPDLERHSVTRIEQGTRWVLSIGWVRGARGARPAA